MNCKVVITPGSKGPPQPEIALVEERVPSLFRITSVPQNANAVLFEPVVLLIDKFNVLYTESPVVHTLQRVAPGKAAPTSVRSFEVQEFAEGNVVVVCANAFEENKQADRKRMSRLLRLSLGDRL